MSIDSKIKMTEVTSRISTSKITTASSSSSNSSPSLQRVQQVPATAQLCGQTHAIARWALFWTATFIQTAHIPFIKLTNKVDNAIQKKATRMLPLLLYLSLLVLALQAGALLTIFATSAVFPPGLWFLVACIAILAHIYCSTYVSTKTH